MKVTEAIAAAELHGWRDDTRFARIRAGVQEHFSREEGGFLLAVTRWANGQITWGAQHLTESYRAQRGTAPSIARAVAAARAAMTHAESTLF